jgi:hypothetical protein
MSRQTEIYGSSGVSDCSAVVKIAEASDLGTQLPREPLRQLGTCTVIEDHCGRVDVLGEVPSRSRPGNAEDKRQMILDDTCP